MFELKEKTSRAYNYNERSFYFDRPQESEALCRKVADKMPTAEEAKGDLFKEQARYHYEQFLLEASYSQGCRRGATSTFLANVYRYYPPMRSVIEAHFPSEDAEENRADRAFYMVRAKDTYYLVDHIHEMYGNLDLLDGPSRNAKKVGQHIFYVEYVTMVMAMKTEADTLLGARSTFLANLYSKIEPVKDYIDEYFTDYSSAHPS